MAKLNYKLDERRALSDGKYPLKFALSHQRKTVYIPSGYSFTKDEWEITLRALSGKKHKSAKEAIISDRKLRLEMALMVISDSVDISTMNINTLKEKLISFSYPGAIPSPDVIRTSLSAPANQTENTPNFLSFYTERMNLKATPGTQRVYLRTLRAISRFEQEKGRDPEQLTFTDITPAWLLEFDRWLTPTNKETSRSIHHRNLRSVLNDAIEEGLPVTYPFSRSSSRRVGTVNDGKRNFKIPVSTPSRHRDLSAEQLRAFRDAPVPEHMRKYRDLFLLSIYLIGVNMGDLLTAKKSQIHNGRLEYVRLKTHVFYSIKIEPEAAEIIQRYKGKEYLLSPCDTNRDYRQFLRRMNEQIKRVGMNYQNREKYSGEPICAELTSYWARHTWTSLAVNIGVPKFIAGRSLGHSWAKDKVTDIYIDLDDRLLDEANRKVLDFLAEK